MLYLTSFIVLSQFSTLNRVLADSSGFQANSSLSADIPFILAEANQTIAQNSSSYASPPFPIGIGENTSVSIYSNWPVIPFIKADIRMLSFL